LVAASKRGRSHANEGKFRDDDFEVKYVKDIGWYIMAVADGAGSAKYSRRGSQIACQFVSQALEEASRQQLGKELEEALKEFKSGGSEQSRSAISRPLYETLGQAAFGALKQIEAEDGAKSAQLRDFATTLLIGVSKKFSFGHFVSAFWIGDGGIAVLDLPGKKVEV
jgi:serine/threonine protein phosphatase PrpC